MPSLSYLLSVCEPHIEFIFFSLGVLAFIFLYFVLTALEKLCEKKPMASFLNATIKPYSPPPPRPLVPNIPTTEQISECHANYEKLQRKMKAKKTAKKRKK